MRTAAKAAPARDWSDSSPAQVLKEVAASVLVVRTDGEVVFANDAANALLSPMDKVGLNLRTMAALGGVSNGVALARAVRAGEASGPIRLDLPDGRILDGQSRPLRNGTAVVTLVDVTRCTRETERTARDGLTGLASRAEFEGRLPELLAQSRRSGAALAVVVMDLSRFKAINDALGRSIGDALLTRVAERLHNAVRRADLVARFDGDEFAIIQPDEPQPQAAEALACRLLDLIGRAYVVSGHVLNVGARVGVAIAPDDGDDAGTLFKRAELALSRARADGGASSRFFRAGMEAEVQARMLLEVDLSAALALRQFELAYQPQVRLEPYELAGFEALLRWRSPARGMVSPGEFIPIAEASGLIVHIGGWVLRTACLDAAAWQRPLSVAVNVSPLQFRGAGLVQAVTSALSEAGLDPARLELEITEGALLDNTDTVLQQLHALKALGVRVSMDDFGTGYSSLSYLLKFPFDKIKIDQSFVRGTEHDANCSTIIRAVTALGASLGITTIAEGIETPEQLARLQAAGCQLVQGYLTGRPAPAAAAAALAGGTLPPLPAMGVPA